MAFSLDEIERYDRQVLLPEWGAAGQERVRAARILVEGDGPAAAAAERYLVAAGVGEVARGSPLPTGEGQGEGAVLVAVRLLTPIEPSITAMDDRESVGAACAVEALKAILGMPFRGDVTLPSLVEPEAA